MRLSLRRLFDSLVARVPSFLVRGLMKTYERNPALALRCGYRVFPQRFDSPLVNPDEIDKRALGERRDLPGIQIDLMAVEELVKELCRYRHELDWIPLLEGTRNVAWSETYPTSDTTFLHALLRHLKPKRYIEVGCGYTSKISSNALRRNKEEGYDCRATYIEPFPGPRLDDVNLIGDLLVKRVQDVPLSFFQVLEEGDVLFIDSTHVLKCQSDVVYEFLHILPTLKQGVHVHVHDIFTPYDYPTSWMIGPRENWGVLNEQYALECLLSNSPDFKITLPLYLILRELPELMEMMVPGATDGAQAIWIVKN